MDGVLVLSRKKWNLTETLSFFSTSDLDLSGLKLILAHLMILSSPWTIHLPLGTEDVVTVKVGSDGRLLHTRFG